jgi:co-chaperonin GroES (HSP10)
MVHQVDPANEIMKSIGSLDEFELTGDQVLLGVYIRPEKTKSGIILSDKTRDEDMHQGKAGLVLKTGPIAFKYSEGYAYEGPVPNIGQWVAMWVTDGRKISINSVLCRIVSSEQVRMIIPAPDVVF